MISARSVCARTFRVSAGRWMGGGLRNCGRRRPPSTPVERVRGDRPLVCRRVEDVCVCASQAVGSGVSAVRRSSSLTSVAGHQCGCDDAGGLASTDSGTRRRGVYVRVRVRRYDCRVVEQATSLLSVRRKEDNDSSVLEGTRATKALARRSPRAPAHPALRLVRMSLGAHTRAGGSSSDHHVSPRTGKAMEDVLGKGTNGVPSATQLWRRSTRQTPRSRFPPSPRAGSGEVDVPVLTGRLLRQRGRARRPVCIARCLVRVTVLLMPLWRRRHLPRRLLARRPHGGEEALCVCRVVGALLTRTHVAAAYGGGVVVIHDLQVLGRRHSTARKGVGHRDVDTQGRQPVHRLGCDPRSTGRVAAAVLQLPANAGCLLPRTLAAARPESSAALPTMQRARLRRRGQGSNGGQYVRRRHSASRRTCESRRGSRSSVLWSCARRLPHFSRPLRRRGQRRTGAALT